MTSETLRSPAADGVDGHKGNPVQRPSSAFFIRLFDSGSLRDFLGDFYEKRPRGLGSAARFWPRPGNKEAFRRLLFRSVIITIIIITFRTVHRPAYKSRYECGMSVRIRISFVYVWFSPITVLNSFWTASITLRIHGHYTPCTTKCTRCHVAN